MKENMKDHLQRILKDKSNIYTHIQTSALVPRRVENGLVEMSLFKLVIS